MYITYAIIILLFICNDYLHFCLIGIDIIQCIVDKILTLLIFLNKSSSYSIFINNDEKKIIIKQALYQISEFKLI